MDNALDSASQIGHVDYAEGFPSDRDLYDETLAKEAIEKAANADKAVIFAGLPDSFESEGYDRQHMRLPDCQNKLIQDILQVQPNTVIVLHNGSPVEMPWLSEVKGVLEAYLSGQAGGSAVANILFGKVNPSGKLAETLPVKLADNPAHLNFGDGDKTFYQEGIFVGYRYYDAKEMDVAFPFGHGLSYTTFAYSNLTTDKTEMTDSDTLTVSVDVTNTGNIAGKETIQLYVRDRTGACRRPDKELKGFQKVALKPGETKTVTMTLDKRSFAWYNTEIKDWYAANGTYELLIGASSRDIRLAAQFQMNGSRPLPLNFHMNTTLGELLKDERSKKHGIRLKNMMVQLFANPEKEDDNETAGDVAVSDEMNDAMAISMPLRNMVSFGLCSKEEIQQILDELKEI